MPLSDFKWALEQAGAVVEVTNTFRPIESCYLMHYAWLIYREEIDPAKVPAMKGVLIEWNHPTKKLSWSAARDMCKDYSILTLKTKPALDSHHSHGEAVDMIISWNGDLTIKDKNGADIEIVSTPRNGMNLDLKKVGASYGVIKYFDGYKDVPHWSTDGR